MSVGLEMKNAILAVPKDWPQLQRKEIGDRNAAYRAQERMFRNESFQTTIKDIVWDNLPEAYDKASGGGKLPTGARQIFYVMRDIVLAELPDKHFDDQYFTQTLL